MNSKTFRTILGKRPILLSAPHVYAHRRPRLSMAYKYGEPLTDVIVEEVCKNVGAYGILLNDESDFDANYHKEKSNPYKQEVRSIVEKENIEAFIDIHGLKDGNMYDIALYYPTKFSKSYRLAKEVRDAIDKGKLRGLNVSIFRFLDNDQEALGKYVASKLRVPSVQIEIARYIRESDVLRNALIENISNVLEKRVV